MKKILILLLLAFPLTIIFADGGWISINGYYSQYSQQGKRPSQTSDSIIGTKISHWGGEAQLFLTPFKAGRLGAFLSLGIGRPEALYSVYDDGIIVGLDYMEYYGTDRTDSVDISLGLGYCPTISDKLDIYVSVGWYSPSFNSYIGKVYDPDEWRWQSYHGPGFTLGGKLHFNDYIFLNFGTDSYYVLQFIEGWEKSSGETTKQNDFVNGFAVQPYLGIGYSWGRHKRHKM